MKRFILLLFVIMNINFAMAMERPRWEDHCPQGMHDAVYKEIQWFWPDGTRSTQEIYNYWAKRRTEFQEELSRCDLKSENLRQICYESLNIKQSSESEIYKQDFENKRMSNQIWKEQRKVNSGVMFNILPK